MCPSEADCTVVCGWLYCRQVRKAREFVLCLPTHTMSKEEVGDAMGFFQVGENEFDHSACMAGCCCMNFAKGRRICANSRNIWLRRTEWTMQWAAVELQDIHYYDPVLHGSVSSTHGKSFLCYASRWKHLFSLKSLSTTFKDSVWCACRSSNLMSYEQFSSCHSLLESPYFQVSTPYFQSATFSFRLPAYDFQNLTLHFQSATFFFRLSISHSQLWGIASAMPADQSVSVFHLSTFKVSLSFIYQLSKCLCLHLSAFRVSLSFIYHHSKYLCLSSINSQLRRHWVNNFMTLKISLILMNLKVVLDSLLLKPWRDWNKLMENRRRVMRVIVSGRIQVLEWSTERWSLH